ncbi:iron ABC transporter permease [Dactylosporangium sp. AC04546]|uniref:ABC transporter permease n=1 Tax=Dactylosporangium sp. AC04546 TaxID=2862460 RepID=UPI001EDDB99D|nr:iron ABC transporter permease [Dactylosporangium sp. AC04546]WVK80699.1 iron ABC transporter permease [Dactylosporangium sp. AC04546]
MTSLATAAPPPTPAPGPPARRPRYRRPLGVGREAWIQYATLGLLAVLVLAPVVPTLYQSVLDRPLYEAGGIFTADNYVHLFTEAGFGLVVLNTALFAVGTTVLTLLIAVPMAVVVVRTKLPGRRVFAAAMQWPFFISSLILGFGWITMYGPAGFVSVQVRQLVGSVPWNLYSIPGMAVTEAVALAPIAYVFCANALRQSDASLESAAQVCGAGPLRILLSVVVPLLRPPIVYSSILVFSMSVETLSVPLLYGQPVGIDVFSTFLYRNGLQSINPSYGILGAASTIILVVTVSLVAVQAKLLKHARRFVSVRGKATRPRPLDIGWLKWVSVAAISCYVVFGALLPIGGLVFRSFTLVFTPLQSPFKTLTTANYERIFHYDAYVQSISNSLIVAGAGAVLVSALAVLAVVVARRSSFRFARAVEYLSLAPQAMPGIIVGVGLFWAFAYAPFGLGGLVQGTLIAIIIGFGLRALPSGFGSIAPSIMQIGQELDQAARVSGADWLLTFTRILGRLLTPAFVGAMVLTFVTMLKEYSPAIFLKSADSNVIGTTMLELWVQGNTGSVAALATLQIAITAAFVGIAGLLMKGHNDA